MFLTINTLYLKVVLKENDEYNDDVNILVYLHLIHETVISRTTALQELP